MRSVEDANPFVGPRSLGQSDDLYGRAPELAYLRDRLVSDRIVLLYSPSGAGKTSLIEAGLRAELDDLDFVVPPTLRLGHSSDMLSVHPTAATERSNGLEDTSLIDIDPAELVAQVAELDRSSDGELCLIFDQFEEIFTLDPGNHDGRRAFIRALGEALRDKHRWALFVIREDFVAQLDPYLEEIPTLLSSRMRLDLLSPQAAMEAVQGPASASGRPFSDDALRALVDDLRKVMRLGSDEPVPGPYVEPVQLQVVCRRVWEAAAAAEEGVIGPERLERSGGVDAALRLFYAEQVGAAAEVGMSEALIRSWISRELVDANGYRRSTVTFPSASPRAVEVVERLERAHLLRAEDRRGNRWYELAHDRLVGPIRDDNVMWTQEHPDDPVVRADLWMQQRLPDLLLSGAHLRNAIAWYRENEEELRDVDVQFLDESQRRQWRRRGGAAVVVCVMLLSVLALFLAVEQTRLRAEAEVEERRANSSELALRSASLDADRALALVLAAEAVSLDTPPPVESLGALVDARVGMAERTWQPFGLHFRGHTNRVRGVAASPQATVLVTADMGGSLRWWNRLSADQIGLPLALEEEGLTTVEWSPDGSIILAGAIDGSVHVVDGRTFESLRELDGAHQKRVSGIAFSPAGNLVATSSWDGEVKLWQLSDLDAQPATILAHDGWAVSGLAFKPDGSRLVTGGGNGKAQVWDVATGQPVEELVVDHGSAVTAVAWSPDGDWILTGGDDHIARLWRADDAEPQGPPMVGHYLPLTSVAFSADGTRIATTGWDSTIRLWDVPAAEWLEVAITGHTAGIADMVWLPDDKTIVSGSDDRTARMFEVSTGDPFGQEISTHSGEVTGVAFDPKGSYVASAGTDGRLTVVALQPDAGEAVLQSHRGAITAIDFSPDGSWLAAAGDDGQVRLVELETALRFGEPIDVHEGAVTDLAFSPDGRLLATTGEKGDIRMTELRVDGTPGERTIIGPVAATTITFSPDGSLLISGDENGVIRFWDVLSGQESGLSLVAHSEAISSLELDPEGRLLASASFDGSIRIWEFPGRRRSDFSLSDNRGRVSDLAWSADGRMLATTAPDGLPRLWSLASGQQVSRRSLDGHENNVTAVAFGPDGILVVTGDVDGRTLLWDAFSVQAGCELALPYVDPNFVQSFLPVDVLPGRCAIGG